MGITFASVSAVGPEVPHSDDPQTEAIRDAVWSALDELNAAVAVLAQLAPRDSRIQQSGVLKAETLVIENGEEWISASPTVIDGTLVVKSGGQFIDVTDARWVVITTVTDRTATNRELVLASAPVTITLPTPTSGVTVAIKNIGVNTVTIGGTVDGTSNPTLPNQYDSKQMVADGSTWWSI